jgi:hypothetical protein
MDMRHGYTLHIWEHFCPSVLALEYHGEGLGVWRRIRRTMMCHECDEDETR